MTEHDWNDNKIPTPSPKDFLKMEEEDGHLWDRIPMGHHHNLFDAAMEEVERLNRAALTEQAEAETQRTENKRLRTAIQRISDVDGGFKECLDKELMKERTEVERLKGLLMELTQDVPEGKPQYDQLEAEVERLKKRLAPADAACEHQDSCTHHYCTGCDTAVALLKAWRETKDE